MKTLRVELKAAPAWYLNPFWLTWTGRVQAFRDSFQGLAFKQVGTPVTGGGWRAIVYMEAPDNVTEAQLDSLRRHWSDNVGGVDVVQVQIVARIGEADTDKDWLEKQTIIGGVTDKLGSVAGDAGRAVLIAVVVIAAVYIVVNKKAGTQEWS